MKLKITIVIVALLSFHSLVEADPYRFQPGDYLDLFVYNAPELCGVLKSKALFTVFRGENNQIR